MDTSISFSLAFISVNFQIVKVAGVSSHKLTGKAEYSEASYRYNVSERCTQNQLMQRCQKMSLEIVKAISKFIEKIILKELFFKVIALCFRKMYTNENYVYVLIYVFRRMLSFLYIEHKDFIRYRKYT